MKMTEDEIKVMRDRACALVDELMEITGNSVLLLVEEEHENGEHNVWTVQRGSPYAAHRMAQMFCARDDNQALSYEMSESMKPEDDEGDNWKGD